MSTTSGSAPAEPVQPTYGYGPRENIDDTRQAQQQVANKTDTTFELEGENSLGFNTHQANTGIVSPRGVVQ